MELGIDYFEHGVQYGIEEHERAADNRKVYVGHVGTEEHYFASPEFVNAEDAQDWTERILQAHRQGEFL